MNTTDISRLIEGLQLKGWTDREILDFIVWLGTGDEQYKPRKKED